ncbi:ABC transporter ATP-binding protein [Pseudogracilibacillus sp. SE30717A]|uniref:ABC transporter ATP-binding protein n=1 Tax=Pseudogracilibacillus sp. SE30717A TaxID=3098293 RepID=UPI00300DD8CB
MESILELKHVNKTYSKSSFSLKNISFSIPYGSIVGFIGENGAGKTTTMDTIIGTRNKDSGTIHLFGEKMEYMKENIKEDIGVVFDSMNFSGNLNVIQISNVFRNIYRQWDNEKYVQYINKFKLPKKELIKNFSRGMSMKLSIAVALSHDAKLLILDEATAGLDPIAREEILEILADFAKDKKRSILLSSHITSDIEKIANQLIFIKKGEIILTVGKKELLTDYSITRFPTEELSQIKSQVIAYQRNEDYTDALIRRDNMFTKNYPQLDFSIDDITILLMKGVKR